MPHIPVHPSAKKRHRQSLKRRERNRVIKTHVRTTLKRATETIAGGDATAAQSELKAATRVLHKAASKGALHRNTVARKVARLSKKLHQAQSAAKPS